MDSLDIAIASIVGGNSGLWRDAGTYIYPANYTQAAFTDSGRLGIGTSNPATTLEVVGEARAQRFAFQDDTDTYMDTVGANEMAFATNGAYQLFINANGNVGIGDTNPQNRLSVSGDIRVRNTDDFYVGSIGLNDNASTTSGASLVGLFDNTFANIAANTNYKVLLVSLILLLVPELILTKLCY